jgi:hypothetical protein
LPEWGAEAVLSGSLVDIRGDTSKAWKPSWNEILPQAGIVGWHPNGRGVVGGSTAGDEGLILDFRFTIYDFGFGVGKGSG